MLLLHFLRLIRFGNLMVIGVTMSIVQAFIALHGNGDSFYSSCSGSIVDRQLDFHSDRQDGGFHLSEAADKLLNFNLDFFLLILSVILIAGAGNIINDYFDIKADRVNKPEKMIVDKYIKRRWAIAWNWIFNVLGLIMAVYLSWKYENYWIALIAFITINFLWFYSALYKRKLFVGNILVALLVGLVPLYVLIYNTPLQNFKVPALYQVVDFGTFFVVKVVVILATIAFMVNLMREIIKDMADIRGDLHLEARTIPISLGIRKTKIILILMMIPLLMLMAFFIFDTVNLSDLYLDSLVVEDKQFAKEHLALFENLQWFILFVCLSGFICMISFGFLLTSNTRKRYLLSSNLLKLAMLFGMVSPLFL